MQHALKQFIYLLLKMSSLRFIVLFMIVAVLVSVMIVLTIDFLWDGRFNAELAFAGVVTPIIDALFLVVFVTAMLDEIRREVAQRKVAEEELVRREKLALLGQVADTMGHELRNPLGVMNNAVYFLQAVLTEADDTTSEYLGIIKEEIADAERIISDLQDAVRTMPPRPEAINIAEVIGQTLRKCDIPASVTAKLDIPKTLSAIRADPMHMHQVFRNLISNAVEAMPEGGMLDIRVDDSRQEVLRISIKDSGAGMTPEQQARLFEPLFTTKARHIGLGLAVVKNLTQANGGRVEAESVPGSGSSFTVVLPSGSGVLEI
jgi:signal transduction histidine kinase